MHCTKYVLLHGTTGSGYNTFTYLIFSFFSVKRAPYSSRRLAPSLLVPQPTNVLQTSPKQILPSRLYRFSTVCSGNLLNSKPQTQILYWRHTVLYQGGAYVRHAVPDAPVNAAQATLGKAGNETPKPTMDDTAYTPYTPLYTSWTYCSSRSATDRILYRTAHSYPHSKHAGTMWTHLLPGHAACAANGQPTRAQRARGQRTRQQGPVN